MTGQPVATIGLPFVNERHTLAHAVRSVFAQTVNDWQLILIQDGSDEDLRTLVSAIDDPRVTVVADGQRRGLPARLNQLATLGDGGILVRMDADDVMVPWRLERVLSALHSSRHPVVASRAFAIDEHSDVRGLYSEPPSPQSPLDYLLSTPFIHPTVAGSRKWFLENPYNEDIRRAEDKELWLRTCEGGPVQVLQEPLLFYRVPSRTALAKLLRTSHDDRGVMRQLRNSVVSSTRDQREYRLRLLRSYAGDAIAALAAAMGRTTWIAQRKVKPLSAIDLQTANIILQSTFGFVPGWNEEMPDALDPL